MTQGRDDEPDKDSVGLFELVQQMAQLGIWHWDVPSNTVTWSDELYRIYGLTPGEFGATFQGYLERVHPEDRERVRRAVQQTLALADRVEFDERIVRPDGSVRVLESVGTMIRDPSGAPLRMVGACMDVTERRALQQRLAQQNHLSAIGTLAAGVAHELNNPLFYVRTALERLQDSGGAQEPDVPSELLRDALQGVDRMAEIVAGLQTHARPQPRAVAALRLADIVHGALPMVSHELRHRAVVELDLDPAVFVVADSTQLGQVVTNLLTNAAQAIPAGQATGNTIRIEVRREAADAVLRVTDTGEGIPVEHASRLFDPFFTTKPVGQGTGLGLFITHRIVVGFGGTLALQPTANGTRALVRLPATEPPATEAPSPAPAAPSAVGARVLIIDDEAMVGRAIVRMLRHHQVTVVTKASEAYEVLAADSAFDLVLCDLMMPDGMGDAVHATIAQRWPDLEPRVHFITGGVFAEELRDFARANDHRLLYKPFRRADLDALLARARGGSES